MHTYKHVYQQVLRDQHCQRCGLGSALLLAHVVLCGAVDGAGSTQDTAGAGTFLPGIARPLLRPHPQHKTAF